VIIPSIDIMDGRAVQLVGGRRKALDAGSPLAAAERFSVAGELAVIDLDAALGRGDNRHLIEQIVRRFRCRVGGGIRSVDSALDWLDRGASRVIIGTAATPELLARLPRQRVMVALDGVNGEVVVEGWRRRTGARVLERIAELAPLVGGLLVTFVEREGRLGGIDLDAVDRVVHQAGATPLTVAGGITSADEVAAIDRLGADAQVGMALYRGRLDLGDAIAAPLSSDRSDGLWPTVVVDEGGVALGLAYSSQASLRAAVAERRGVYQSRSRGLWRKGESSGNRQRLLRIDLDCDRDTLRFVVDQQGAGFCHRQTTTCWGPSWSLAAFSRHLASAATSADPGSYTARLLADPELLARKLAEEADELAGATTPQEATWEAADLIYFTTVALIRNGVSTARVLRELERRAAVTRRRDGSRMAAAGGA
jgi:phosphoribosyl-ATP pyrophosphohydrolase